MVGLLMATSGDVAATAFGTMCELGWIGAAGVMVVVVEFFTANLNWLNAGVQQPLQEGLALLAVPHIYRVVTHNALWKPDLFILNRLWALSLLTSKTGLNH